MRRPPVLGLFLFAAVAASAVAVAAALPAGADGRQEAVSAEQQQAVETFWTAERRHAAEVAATGSPPESWGAAWPGRTIRGVGKIFFALPGRADQLGVCSGAVVDSANRSVVVTAAHCIYLDEDGGHHSNFYFVPAYDHQRSSFGHEGWTARASFVSSDWRDGNQYRNLQHDYGFLTLNDKGGQAIADAAGAHGIQFDAPVPGAVLAIGYPTAFPYDGESLQYCHGRPRTAAQSRMTSGPGTGDNLVLMPCTLTQGASGGPWLTDYDPATDRGTVVAVNSVGGGGTVIGRPLKAEARTLFDAAQSG